MIQNRSVRRDIDRHLRRPMTDGEWTLLDSQGHLRRLECSQIGPAGLADVINQWREAVGTSDRVTLRYRAGVSEQRSAAIQRIIAQEAARDEDVVSFRTTEMRGRLIKPADIEKWIQRQAKKDGSATNYLRIPMPQDVRLGLNDRGLVPEPPIIVSVDWPAVGTDLEVLDYPREDSDRVHSVPVAREGVLQKLMFLSKDLARRYGWQSAQATGFVLCGLPPELPPLRIEVSTARLGALSRVKLTVDPAVSPRVLAAAYKNVRNRLMTSRHRPLQEKKQTLAVFMSSRPSNETQRESMAVWNKSYAKWKYKEIRNFGRDVAAARRQLLNPGHLDLSSLSRVQQIVGARRMHDE